MTIAAVTFLGIGLFFGGAFVGLGIGAWIKRGAKPVDMPDERTHWGGE